MLSTVSNLKVSTCNKNLTITKPANQDPSLQPLQNIGNSCFHGYKVFLLSLPVETLKIIFSYFQQRDFVAMSTVCKEGKTLAHRFIKHLDFSANYFHISEPALREGLKGWSQPNSQCTSINLSRCYSMNDDLLKYLAEWFPFLTSIDLSFRSKLNEYSLHYLAEHFPFLTALTLKDLSLPTGEGLETFKSLTALDLSSCHNFKNIDRLKGLTGLISLNLGNWISVLNTDIFNIDVFKDLPTLTSLDLSGCTGLTDIDALKYLTVLTSLDLTLCTRLRNIDGLNNLISLTSLNLLVCSELKDLNALKNHTALTSLDLGDCCRLTNLDALKNLKALTFLNLRGCYTLVNLNGIENLSNLTSLIVNDDKKSVNLAALKHLTTLTSLTLNSRPSFNLDVLRSLNTLKVLNMQRKYNFYDYETQLIREWLPNCVLKLYDYY